MNLHNRYPDVLGERQHDPRLEQCIADLDATCAALTMPTRRDAALARALRSLGQRRRAAPRGRVARASGVARQWRVAAAAVALLMCGAGYLRLESPIPVSAAQATLNHAVATLRADAAGGALHAVYTVASTGTTGATVAPPTMIEEWAQGDASGTIIKATLIFSDTAGHVQGRTVLSGDAATTYYPGSNTVVTGTVDHASLPSPLDVAGLAQLVQQAQQGGQGARLLPAQTLDGVAVQVVEVDRATDDAAHQRQKIRVYIDAKTSIVRGLNFETDDATGVVQGTTTVHLTTFEIVDPSAVPANTFALHAPASARVIPSRTGSHHVAIAQAMAAQVAAPAPLLAGPLTRLRDVQIGYLAGSTAVGYLYGPDDRHFLSVFVVTDRRGAVQRIDPLMRWPSSVGRSLTLTIAGQRVHATYYQVGADTHILLYLHGGSGVRIIATGTSQTAFFNQVHALVDGRTHPAMVVQAQHDLALVHQDNARAH